MNDSIIAKLYKHLPWLQPKRKPIDTLTAFIKDAEHDVLSVVTALQAHIDLLYGEQLQNHLPVVRFAVLNRAVARIITDITALSNISELVLMPPSNQKQMLKRLMQEITQETQSAFALNHVSLSCDIEEGTILTGNVASLKTMITALVLAILHKAKEFETVRIVGLTNKKRVSLSFNTYKETAQEVFKRWQLGKLRFIPTNGEGISLATVDAMARLHNGHLSVSNFPNEQHGYKLTFKVL
ncbi:MAG: hypothetical protein K2W82_03565 [Candidatus Obscuribacterales bacterium]|nr:hypothetical protein [Candidatus Obscuribacterales bacterium]